MTCRPVVKLIAVAALAVLVGAIALKNHRGVVELRDYATPNDGKDDTQGLHNAMAEGCVVLLGPYDWDFDGPLIKGEDANFGRCRIIGPVDEYACQHLEEGDAAGRRAALLNIRGLKPGEYWIDLLPGKRTDGKEDRGGKAGVVNAALQINGHGCAIRIGNIANTSSEGMDVRGLELSGLYVTAPDQVAHHHFDGELLPEFAHDSLIEIIRGYDVTIHNVGIRGGGTQLRLVQCDRPSVSNLHMMWGVRGLVIDSLSNNAAVEAAVSNVFVEGPIVTGFDCESAQVSQVRVEVGYDTQIGRKKLEAPWKIDAGGSRVELAAASDRLCAGQLVYVDGLPLRVSSVDAGGFSFDESQSHCYFAKAASGESIDACYGVGVIGRGDRFSIVQWSSDQNRDLPGLPVAAFVPWQTTLPVGHYANNRGSWIGEDNRSVIVGHCSGRQWAVEASVDFAGTYMRPDHPLCHPGIGPVPDPNWNRWLGLWAGDEQSRSLRFRYLDGKWVVRLDDSKTGRRMPPPADRKYAFHVYAHEKTKFSVYGGKGRPTVFDLEPGWQNVQGIFTFEPSMLLLGSAPISVEFPQGGPR